MFDINPNDLVLDVACGDGLDIMLLRSMGINNIQGLDMSSHLLQEAKKRNPGTKFVLGKAEHLPFPDKQFSVVLVDSVFHHLTNFEKTLKEIRRVLRPGGILCFIEPHRALLRRLLDWVSTLPVSQYIPLLKDRAIGYLEEKHLVTHWLKNEERFKNLLIRLGFRPMFCKVDFLSIVGQYQRP